MRGATQESDLWGVLAKVRGVRVRRRLRALAEARRHEQEAAAAVSEQIAALERHAVERQRVLAFCLRDQGAGRQWHATLRAHDAQTPVLQQQLSDAQHGHALARQHAGEALRNWNIERARHDDARERWRAALARVARDGCEHG